MAANLGTVTHSAFAIKDDISVTIQYASQSANLKEIAHVSTQSAGARINVTPASIASVAPSDYAFQGNTSWKELLNQIPGVTVGGALANGISSNNTIPDGPFQPVVLSINGALPYETATTLDGMPIINQSFIAFAGAGTNLAFLPMSMFDTADVVRGPGANAPSIVDSIGGSFVLHPPGRVEKNAFEFSISNDAYGGVVANAKAAVRFGKASATIAYGINNSPGPLGSQTVVSADAVTPLTVNGQPFSSGGFTGFVDPPGFQPSTCFCVVRDTLLYYGVPVNTNWTQHSGAIAISYDISPSVVANVFYAGSSMRMPLPVQIYPVTFTPGPGYSGSIAPGAQNFIFASSGPSAEAQASSLFEEKLTAHIGTGILRLAALQNNSFAGQDVFNRQPNGRYTLYGTGFFASAPSTPVNFNGQSALLTFTPFVFTSEVWSNNRDMLASFALPIGARSSFDASYVTSYYNNPGTSLCTFSSNPPISRGNLAAISAGTQELRLHVGTQISETLSLDASWYVTKGTFHVPNPNNPSGPYTDSIFRYSAPRLGAVWRANNNTAVRFAAGGGYALPPLNNLMPAVFASTPFCLFGTCSLNLANVNLNPEKSFGFDLDTDIRMHRNYVLSFDLYRMNLYGQFFQSTTTTTCSAVVTCPPGDGALPLFITQFGNLSQSRYEGVNIDVRDDTPKGIYWHVALGLTRAYVVNVPAGFYNGASGFPATACTNCANLYIVPGINFDGKFQSPVPYANGSAQIGYRWSPQKYIDLSPAYYGNGNAYFHPAFLEFDAHGGYPLTKNLSLLFTARNITGIYGQNYQTLLPTMGAPSVIGAPFALLGIPYGPRTVILTVNANL